MPTITILCPYHGVPDQLELPESYARFEGTYFEGHIPCGRPTSPCRAILNIEIIHSKVSRVELIEQPSGQRVSQFEEHKGPFGSPF